MACLFFTPVVQRKGAATLTRRPKRFGSCGARLAQHQPIPEAALSHANSTLAIAASPTGGPILFAGGADEADVVMIENFR